jgi:hypothetical protein
MPRRTISVGAAISSIPAGEYGDPPHLTYSIVYSPLHAGSLFTQLTICASDGVATDPSANAPQPEGLKLYSAVGHNDARHLQWRRRLGELLCPGLVPPAMLRELPRGYTLWGESLLQVSASAPG